MKLGMGEIMAEMESEQEAETWTRKESVAYRVTVRASATATRDNRQFGFSREIGGHDATCTSTLKRAGGETIDYCKYSRLHLSEAEACSLVRKGQGSVYRITQVVERIK